MSVTARLSFAAVLILGGQASGVERATDGSIPADVGLVERVQRRLAQIDVSIEGPANQIAGLTLDQFRVSVAGKDIVPSSMDRLCPERHPDRSETSSVSSEGESAVTTRTSYLFYFDQRNMNMIGHHNSLDVAEKLVSKLVTNGNRAAIVSSGKRVATFANFTTQQDVLRNALNRIRSDPSQWDDYPMTESTREQEIANVPYEDKEGACQRAKMYQKEELTRAYAALDRFVSVLGRFAEMDSPKVAIYFADTLRSDPGRHYLVGAGGRCEKSSFSDQLSFRQVHERAATLGIKLYAVQAEGITSPDMTAVRRARAVAETDAQGGLKGLTLETGGDAFLNGASADSMTRRMGADNACVYVLSFDPSPFPEDTALPVSVDVGVKGIRVRARTQIVIQSESARRMSTLLAAFTAPDDAHDALRMQGGLVPLEVKKGKLHVLVQASVPDTKLAGEEWDIGMSLVSGGSVTHEPSGRVLTKHAGVRLVLESEMDIGEGPFDLTMIGMENATGRLGVGHISGIWPGKLTGPRVVATAVMQPAEGAFLRDRILRETGSLIVADGEPVRAGLPTAFVTLVCRAPKDKGPLRVRREVSGEASADWTPIELPSDGPCAQVRDVVPAGGLSKGTHTYSVVIEGTDIGASRTLVVE